MKNIIILIAMCLVPFLAACRAPAVRSASVAAEELLAAAVSEVEGMASDARRTLEEATSVASHRDLVATPSVASVAAQLVRAASAARAALTAGGGNWQRAALAALREALSAYLRLSEVLPLPEPPWLVRELLTPCPT